MNMAIVPRVCIILPSYNSEKYLTHAIYSFVKQNYSNKKLIIIDGKSSDRSHEIINEFLIHNYPIIWDKTIDTGIANAFNIGLNYIEKDDIVGFLGADDILIDGIIEEASTLLSVAKFVDALYFDSYSYFAKDKKLYYRKCPTDKFSIKNLIKFRTIAGLQNVFIRGHNILDGFSEENKYSMDYELYLRLVNDKKLNFSYIPKPSTININDLNTSTLYRFESARESLHVAIKKFGYRYPYLIIRLLILHVLRTIKYFD